MATDWNDILLAYLHDPPDKALGIKDHVSRAYRYAEAVLNDAVSGDEFTKHADHVASAVERLSMPTAGPNGERAVGPRDQRLEIVHPLSGRRHPLPVGRLDPEQAVAATRGLTAGLDAERQFLALWRLWPETLAALHPCYGHLPADTRTPDHTIWNHLDITAGLRAAEAGGHGAALLSFALGPVQSFIATARTVRDLWTGSMILSYLTFRALLPVVESQGPTALVYPSLRGIPLIDLWLQSEKGFGDRLGRDGPDEDLRRAPCLPNRFLAVVPWGPDGAMARGLAEASVAAAKRAWREMAESVRKRLDGCMSSLPHGEGWDRCWHDQINCCFDFRSAVLPLGGSRENVDGRLANLLQGMATFREAFPGAGAVRQLARALRRAGHAPGYDQEHAGRWQYQVELSARLLQAQRAVRPVPMYQAEGPTPPKCSLLGTYEQMGPDKLEASRQFWEGDPARNITGATARIGLNGVRLRRGERLCAVALVKRFAAPAYLADRLGLTPEDLRFPDTATVAAAEWLSRARLDPEELRRMTRARTWSGQWLHWPRRDFDQDEEPCPESVWDILQRAKGQRELGRPPTYYAILMMDGDDMGRWLRGEKSPQVREVMHPDLVGYYQGLSAETKAGLDARRPVGPALHAAISEALTNFALHFVPRIVSQHHGTLIYAGGDDVLALLPTATVLACARALREAFRQDWASDGQGAERLLMGERAGVSAGIAVVHMKEDLRFALQTARDAEKAAKGAGRDILQVTVCRRSGEHGAALCPWEEVGQVIDWIEAFRQDASDRWAYHLAGELPTLRGLRPEAMRAEIRRQVDRAEEPTRRRLGATKEKSAGQCVGDAFERYRLASSQSASEAPHRRLDDAQAVTQFVKLCQTASFLARGRDR